jgi:hypothetical protein
MFGLGSLLASGWFPLGWPLSKKVNSIVDDDIKQCRWEQLKPIRKVIPYFFWQSFNWPKNAQGCSYLRRICQWAKDPNHGATAKSLCPLGERSCLSLFGSHADQHRLLGEHLTAEYRVRTGGRGRSVDEWKMRPERSDNHFLDCIIGAAVPASMQVAQLPGILSKPETRTVQRVSFAELQKKRRR